ncbi:MAG: hypothetical protein GC159_00630 [Phycisphaera sp.]|nr:hypothetical protein [Phycisphaera sp.]
MPNIYKFRCPHCHKKHGVPPEYVGRVVECGGCGNRIHVIGEEATPPPATHGQTKKPAAPTGPSDTEISSFFDGDDSTGQWKPTKNKRKPPSQR